MLKKLIMGGVISALLVVALPAFASAQCGSNGGSTTPIVSNQNQGCTESGSNCNNANDLISKILGNIKGLCGSNSKCKVFNLSNMNGLNLNSSSCSQK